MILIENPGKIWIWARGRPGAQFHSASFWASKFLIPLLGKGKSHLHDFRTFGRVHDAKPIMFKFGDTNYLQTKYQVISENNIFRNPKILETNTLLFMEWMRAENPEDPFNICWNLGFGINIFQKT